MFKAQKIIFFLSGLIFGLAIPFGYYPAKVIMLKMDLSDWVQNAAANAAAKNVCKGRTNVIDNATLQSLFPKDLPMESELSVLYSNKYNLTIARELGERKH